MVSNSLNSVALGLALSLMATSSYATGSISCGGADSDISVLMTLGAGPVPNVVQAEVGQGDVVYSTIDAERPAAIARVFIDEQSIVLDMMDDQASTQVAEVRVLRAMDDEGEGLQIGYARVKGMQPVAIICDGP